MALTFGFTRSICFRCSASASRAESFFARISRAISTALRKQRSFEVLADASRGAAVIPISASRRVGWSALIPEDLLFKHGTEMNCKSDLVDNLVMSVDVNIHEAKTHLSRLLEKALAGEDVVIMEARQAFGPIDAGCHGAHAEKKSAQQRAISKCRKVSTLLCPITCSMSLKRESARGYPGLSVGN